MKKLSFIFIAALVFAWGASSAQCTINTNNSTTGFTPSPANPITQGVVFAQTTQVYVPPTMTVSGLTANIDSIEIDSIGNLPSGITAVYNPSSRLVTTTNVPGGTGQGAICFAGTTNDTVGTYNLVFHGRAYVYIPLAGSYSALPLNTPPVSTNFKYSFIVSAPAPPVQSCDTISNVTSSDALSVFPWQSPAVGFLSGNGALPNSQGTGFLPIVSAAEKLTGGIGDSVDAAIAKFAYVVIKNTHSDSILPVGFYVYNADGPLATGQTTGGPGTVIDSAFTTLANVASAVTQGKKVFALFNGAAKLTTAEFYIVITFPQSTGDTVVLATSNGQTPDGRGYLGISTPGGVFYLAYTNFFQGADSVGNFVAASVCGTAPIAPSAAFNTSAIAICTGTSVSFTDASTGTVNGYSWDFGDGSAIVNSQNATHTFSTPGQFTVLQTVTNGGGSTSFSTDIYVSPTPTATDVTVNATSQTATNGSAVVTATGGTAPFTFVWSAGTSTNDTLSGVAAGTYTVSITDSNGCRVVDTIVISFTNGINTLAADVQVKIYPNPASDVLNFVWNVNSVAEIKMYDITGALVKTFEVNGTAVNRFNIQDLAQGSYLIRVTDMQTNGQRSTLFNKF